MAINICLTIFGLLFYTSSLLLFIYTSNLFQNAISTCYWSSQWILVDWLRFFSCKTHLRSRKVTTILFLNLTSYKKDYSINARVIGIKVPSPSPERKQKTFFSILLLVVHWIRFFWSCFNRQQFLEPGESVLMISMVKKLQKLTNKKVQLILTNKPKLIYVDPAKLVVKGNIIWSDNPNDLSIQVTSPSHFKICTVSPLKSYISNAVYALQST